MPTAQGKRMRENYIVEREHLVISSLLKFCIKKKKTHKKQRTSKIHCLSKIENHRDCYGLMNGKKNWIG